MATTDLKQRVLEYVQKADEPLLQLMESLAQQYRKDADPSALTEEQWNLIDERWERHLRGEGRSYSLEEVMENIEKARRDGL